MSTGVCVCEWARLIAGVGFYKKVASAKGQPDALQQLSGIGLMCLESVKEVSGMLMITLGIFYEAKIALWRLYSDT